MVLILSSILLAFFITILLAVKFDFKEPIHKKEVCNIKGLVLHEPSYQSGMELYVDPKFRYVKEVNWKNVKHYQ